MPTPTTTTVPAKKLEKPKSTGRFISPTEGQRIASAAKGWAKAKTPYGTGKYAGGGAVKGEKGGADCSGATWKIYAEAGFPYGGYFNTVRFVNRVATDSHFIVAWLKDLVGSDADFVKGEHFFKEVFMPQVGDIGWWKGHMAIYDQNSGMCGKQNKTVGNIWSAYNSTDGINFGAAHTSFWDIPNGVGNVVWYRYWIAP